MSLPKVPIWLWSITYGIKFFPKNAFYFILVSFGVGIIPALNVLVTSHVFNNLDFNTTSAIFWAIVALGLVFGVGTVLNAIPYPIGFMMYRKIYRSLEDDYERVLVKVPPRYYNDKTFIEKSNAARQAVQEELVPQLAQATVNLLSAIFTSVTLSIAIWSFNSTAGFISIFVPLPIIIGTAYLGHFEATNWPKSQHEHRIGSYFQDQLSYQRSGVEIASMKAGTEIANLSNERFLNFIKLRRSIHLKSTIVKFSTGVFSSLLFAASLYFLAQDATLGTIFAGIAGLVAGISSMVNVGWSLSDFVILLPGAKHLIDFLKTEVEDTNVADQDKITQLRLENIRVKYDGNEVVKGINIDVKPGSFTALIGENGSGKTSLLKALMGMQLDASGIVNLGSQQIDLSDKGQVIDYNSVNQEFGRYELTLREFLCLGLKYIPTDEQLWDAIDKVEMRDVIEEFPRLFNTKLGVQWGGVDLSGGQWQRLAIARCFLSQNKIMILDEPTSAIDAPTEERIFQRLAAFGKDRYIFLTTHRASSLKEASNIYVLDKGNIVEQGTFAELDKPGTHFVKMFESQLNTRIGDKTTETANITN